MRERTRSSPLQRAADFSAYIPYIRSVVFDSLVRLAANATHNLSTLFTVTAALAAALF